MNKESGTYSEKEIEIMYDLFHAGKSTEEIAYELQRSISSVVYKLGVEGLKKDMSEKQMDQETAYADTAYNVWDKFGYDVVFGRSMSGYVRSNMKNGLPEKSLSAKKTWENGGKQNFKKIVEHRRKFISDKNKSLKSGRSTAPLVGWLDDFLED